MVYILNVRQPKLTNVSYDEQRQERMEKMKEKKDWWLTDVKVEFDKLKAENPDIIGWIRFAVHGVCVDTQEMK